MPCAAATLTIAIEIGSHMGSHYLKTNWTKGMELEPTSISRTNSAPSHLSQLRTRRLAREVKLVSTGYLRCHLRSQWGAHRHRVTAFLSNNGVPRSHGMPTSGCAGNGPTQNRQI